VHSEERILPTRSITDSDEPSRQAGGGPPAAALGFLSRVAILQPRLRRSERKVAGFLLREPGRVVRMSLATLAEQAEVSQPTAIRFCRAVGCDGFADLKIRIAQALASGARYVHSSIAKDDALDTIADKVFGSSVEALQYLRRQLDMDAVARAVDALARANRIDLIGNGLSSVAAIDAHQKFMRLGVPTVFHPDSHLQRMSAATLKAGDAAMVFSYTGQLRDVARTTELAATQGATVIGITRSGSAVARLCSITIGIDTLENTFVYAPMTTRLAHLVVVDLLATAVALRSGETGVAQIRRVKSAMRDEWLIDGDAEIVAEGLPS
jgi:RpiR family transcriptional regulator, carbohydrate utilization regulator